MARYKWVNSQEWLVQTREKMAAEATSDGTHSAMQEAIVNLLDDLRTLVQRLDADDIQDDYQDEMSNDGYFRDLDLIADLSREKCVSLLDGISIECRDEETVEELREAVESNLEDGTLAWEDIENA